MLYFYAHFPALYQKASLNGGIIYFDTSTYQLKRKSAKGMEDGYLSSTLYLRVVGIVFGDAWQDQTSTFNRPPSTKPIMLDFR